MASIKLTKSENGNGSALSTNWIKYWPVIIAIVGVAVTWGLLQGEVESIKIEMEHIKQEGTIPSRKLENQFNLIYGQINAQHAEIMSRLNRIEAKLDK